MTYSSTVIADGPVSYYHLNETSGTTANDSSGNGHNGTINGTVTLNQAGRILDFGSASILFDGSTGYVSVPSTGLPSGNNVWSMEGWFQPTSVSQTEVLFSFGTNANNEEPNMYISSAGELIQSTWNADQNVQAVSVSTWYYVATTYDGTNQVAYVNGSQVVTHAPGTVAVPANSPGTIARAAGSTSQFFLKGYAQEVAFYAKTLSAAQVLAHYQAGITAGGPYAAVAADALAGLMQATVTDAVSGLMLAVASDAAR